MNRVYKYMHLDYLKDALDYGAYASKLSDVNDPYEKVGIENINCYGIVCMTNSPKKMLLWSYYVKHIGCCVEFDLPSQFKPYVNKVKYDKKLNERYEMNIPEIIESLGHKGAEWKHENEYRAIYYSEMAGNSDLWAKKEDTDDVFLRLPVKSVCFGIYAHKSEDYVQSLKLIMKYNEKKENNINIKKVKISPQKYELIDDKQFNIIEELKKYE